jgi:hypothetical protein
MPKEKTRIFVIQKRSRTKATKKQAEAWSPWEATLNCSFSAAEARQRIKRLKRNYPWSTDQFKIVPYEPACEYCRSLKLLKKTPARQTGTKTTTGLRKANPVKENEPRAKAG